MAENIVFYGTLLFGKTECIFELFKFVIYRVSVAEFMFFKWQVKKWIALEFVLLPEFSFFDFLWFFWDLVRVINLFGKSFYIMGK